MHTGRASVTAHRVALRRAAHQLVDSPRILNDPLALRIIGTEAEKRLRAGLGREHGRAARMARTFMAVRSRFAEDALAEAAAGGVVQYVVLGAGLDTSAYRRPAGEGLRRMFEVDHPATQAWKRRRMTEGGIAVPAQLTFVPVNFEVQSLAAELRGHGFDERAPAFFSWLGVTMYLTREALFGTLRFVASLPARTTVVFDYSITPAALSWRGKLAFWLLARRVAKAGEPWRTTFLPDELIRELRATGFRAACDAGAGELNGLYCRGRADGLRVSGLAHLMKATV